LRLVQNFLVSNASRLGLACHGVDGTPSCLLLTPWFSASRHVVVLVLASETGAPCLVAKLPRRSGDGGGVEREAANLQHLERVGVGGGSVPKVVALELVAGRPMLLETALAGRPMDQYAIRREPARCLEAVNSWLLELPWAPASGRRPDWYETLLERPLRQAAAGGLLGGGSLLVERTLDLIEPLRHGELPLVVQHGDLSDPNLLWLEDGRVGVVDWELSEQHGLPAHDLCFFLAYLAIATARARRLKDQVVAFHNAFIAPGAWARPLVVDYADRSGLTRSLLTPLFVACWANYVTGLLARGVSPVASRYHAFWRHTVQHADALDWSSGR
jgi:aminoglycoside phosphotransferase (APT) family kinase protein